MQNRQGNTQLDPQTLRRLLIAIMLRDMMQGQQGNKGEQSNGQQGSGQQQPSTLDKLVAYYNQARTGVNAAESAYKLYNSLFNSPSSGSGAAISNVGSGTGLSSGSSGGFNSVGEMVGNGYYTPAPSSTGAAVNQSVNTSGVDSTGGSVSWGDIAPYVNGAVSAYNAYQAYRNKNLNDKQRYMLMGSAAAQASTPWTKGYGSAVAGALNAGAALAGKGTEEEKAQQAAHQAGMAVANYYTAGLAGLADGFARKQWSGTMKKIDKFRFNTPGTPEWGLMQVNKLFDTDAWKKEGNRVRQLVDAGVDIPEAMRYRMYQKRGLRKEELLNPNYAGDFQGWTKDGYVNNKFENSRNEGDMTYETLAPYAAWAEKRNDWWKLSDAQRKAITDRAQAAGAIREHHGTLDVDWNKVGDVDQILASVPKQGQQIKRPGKGQVAWVSPGMYMNDQGRVGRALTTRQALQDNYGKNMIPRRGAQ